MPKKKLFVPITGGLGNQLFQIAAADFYGQDCEIIIDPKIGKPRNNFEGRPDCSDFSFPTNLKFLVSCKENKFHSKVFGYLLRSGLEKRNIEKIPGFLFLMKVSAAIIFSSRYKRPLWVYINRGVGDGQMRTPKFSGVLIGYFQSYKNIKDAFRKQLLTTFRNAVEPKLTVNGSQSSLDTNEVLVVHYRRGDYKFEDKMGIPNSGYYLKSLDYQMKITKYDKIWIFSDEISEARKLFPNEFLATAEFIDDSKLSPAQILKKMSQGTGFIIANSTFSWWAAFLSNAIPENIVSPTPWFKYSDEPLAIVPIGWNRVAAWE